MIKNVFINAPDKILGKYKFCLIVSHIFCVYNLQLYLDSLR